MVVEEFAAVPASEGLVSYLPQFSEFGQFRDSYGESLPRALFCCQNRVSEREDVSKLAPSPPTT